VAGLSRPSPLSEVHDCTDFDSGRPQLDAWLRERALRNQRTGASRTYVACEGVRVVAFYSLAAGAVAHREAPGKLKRNMPDPIPVMVLGRLAVDRAFQGHGLDRALLQDAILRTLQAADIAGLRAIIVHAKDESAQRFYERFGFLPAPANPRTLALPLQDASAQLRHR
jgi:GNAT superfamily N-acetyltransferase